MGFVRLTITKMADKMAAASQLAHVDTLLKSFLLNFMNELLCSNSRLSLNVSLVHSRES